MDLRIDMEKDIAYIKLSGKVDKKSFLDALELAITDNRYRKGVGRLWDFSQADLSDLTVEDVIELGQYTKKFPAGINDVKVAFMAPGNIEYGLSRMFEMTTTASTTIHVFRTMDEAEKWLAGDEEIDS